MQPALNALTQGVRGNRFAVRHKNRAWRALEAAEPMHDLVRIRVRDGRPVSYEDFITGWQGPTGRRWGRPADVMVHKDGSLLISDDAAGAIYRVTRTEGR